MQTKNSTASRKGSGKYQPQPNYTPIYGVKLFAIENGFAAAFVAMVLYAIARFNMCIIEQQNASSFDLMSLLGMLAVILLIAGGITYLVTANSRNAPGVFLFFGLLMLMASDVIFCVILAFDTLSETSLLGVVQSILEVFFLASIAVLLASLLISCLGRRIAPWLGTLGTVMSISAVALTAVRTVSTFASLTSALGLNFSWNNAAGLLAELGWVMRTVSTDSAYAEKMYYARLFERIALILMYALILTLVTRFSSFFKQYNMQMEIAAELPGRHNVRKQRGTPYMTGHFDLLTSFHSLREQDRADARERQEEEEPAPDDTPLTVTSPAYGTGYFDDSDLVYIPLEPEKEPVQQPEPEQTAPEEEAEDETPAIPVKYNTNPLDENYGLPIEEDDSVETDSESSAPAQRVKLKPRSPYLAPDDPELWNRYSDK